MNLRLEIENIKEVHLKDIEVLLAHGVRVGNQWRFTGGGNVVETVIAYNRYARTQGFKPIEFLAVCNEAQASPLGIRIGEFDVSENIAYAVGENVHLTWGGKSKTEANKTFLEVSVNDTFFGLDKLISHKKLQSRIKILS